MGYRELRSDSLKKMKMSEILTHDNIMEALEENLISIQADFSIPGETQYVLALTNHPANDVIDSFDKMVFIGSIPGSEIIHWIIYEYFGNGEYTDEMIDYLLDFINRNQPFAKLLSEDLESRRTKSGSDLKKPSEGRCVPF